MRETLIDAVRCLAIISCNDLFIYLFLIRALSSPTQSVMSDSNRPNSFVDHPLKNDCLKLARHDSQQHRSADSRPFTVWISVEQNWPWWFRRRRRKRKCKGTQRGRVAVLTRCKVTPAAEEQIETSAGENRVLLPRRWSIVCQHQSAWNGRTVHSSAHGLLKTGGCFWMPQAHSTFPGLCWIEPIYLPLYQLKMHFLIYTSVWINSPGRIPLHAALGIELPSIER